jgi:hypothetical protein
MAGYDVDGVGLVSHRLLLKLHFARCYHAVCQNPIYIQMKC